MSSSDESDSSGSSGDERENLHVATTANDDDDDDVAHRSNSSDEDKSSDTQAAVVNNLPGSDDDDDKSSTVVALNQQTSSSDDDERQKSSNQVDNAQTTARELFGEADLSLSDDDDDDEDVDKNRQMTADDIVGPRLYPDPDDEEQEVAAPPESVIEVEAPKITVDLGNDGPYFVKFPNFLSVEPRPFDPDHYEDEIDEDEQLDEEGRSRLKLKVENTIRWRYAEDETGQVVKQSNSKLVRWSDGSLSLQLGSEIFDVHLQPIQDHNHLFVRQGAGLQGQSVFRTKLTFRPHSTDTLTHRKMTLSMADFRSNKTQKVKVLSAVGADPETQKQELVRREEERLRATARRESQQRRVRERMSGRHGLSAGFLEPDRDDDSDEGESLSAIKKSYRPGGREFDQHMRSRDGGDDSGSGESDAGRRLDAAKKDSDASDSDKELREKRRTKRKIVIEDDDDEK